MPYSSYAGKEFISKLLENYQAKNVLDLGPGAGTYSHLFRNKIGGNWTAVEIWEPYISKFDLSKHYDRIFCQDARLFVKTLVKNQFDLIFAGDILEHMTKEEAKQLVDICKNQSENLIISIPIGYYPQGEYDSNPFETHIVDNWTHEDFISYFDKPFQNVIEQIGPDQNIGVYFYKRSYSGLVYVGKTSVSKTEECGSSP